MVEKYIKFVCSREGEKMPKEYVKGYLKGAQYAFDRASYKLWRPLHESKFAEYKQILMAYEKGMEDVLSS